MAYLLRMPVFQFNNIHRMQQHLKKITAKNEMEHMRRMVSLGMIYMDF